MEQGYLKQQNLKVGLVNQIKACDVDEKPNFLNQMNKLIYDGNIERCKGTQTDGVPE